jgi:L-seryl-tRNA(Ser) seleniumtransferase
VPRTDAVLADVRLAAALAAHPREVVRSAVAAAQDRCRDGEIGPDDVVTATLAALPTGMREVLNATGVVLHTNLGRAPLSEAARRAIDVAARGYVDVELDLASGSRARRGRTVEGTLLAAIPAAEAALVVNNGAAALVLATLAVAGGREVLVSRGELVEIGDGFRLTSILASVGVRLVEVGATNRTTLGDYRGALTPDTGAVLKVHPSNFRVQGFTAAVDVRQLAALGVPVVYDIGSGLLRPDPLLPDEPDATTAPSSSAGRRPASRWAGPTSWSRCAGTRSRAPCGSTSSLSPPLGRRSAASTSRCGPCSAPRGTTSPAARRGSQRRSTARASCPSTRRSAAAAARA